MRKKRLLKDFQRVSINNLRLEEQVSALNYGAMLKDDQIKSLKDEIDLWREKYARLLERHISFLEGRTMLVKDNRRGEQQ